MEGHNKILLALVISLVIGIIIGSLATAIYYKKVLSCERKFSYELCELSIGFIQNMYDALEMKGVAEEYNLTRPEDLDCSFILAGRVCE